MLSLYLSQTSWLHRLPAGLKLFALVFASVLLLPTTHLGMLATGLGLSLLAYLSLGAAGRRRLVSVAKTLGPMVAVLAAMQWLSLILTLGYAQGGVEGLRAATVTVGRLATLILLADLVTLSTPTQALLRAIDPVLRPLQAIGLPAKKIQLAIGLMLRWVSLIQAQWSGTRMAFQARGCLRPRTRLIGPVITGASRSGHRLADALAARQASTRSPAPDQGQTASSRQQNAPRQSPHASPP